MSEAIVGLNGQDRSGIATDGWNSARIGLSSVHPLNVAGNKGASVRICPAQIGMDHDLGNPARCIGKHSYRQKKTVDQRLEVGEGNPLLTFHGVLHDFLERERHPPSRYR